LSQYHQGQVTIPRLTAQLTSKQDAFSKAQGCEGFASFDQRLAKAAKEVSGMEVRTP
jgi:hypothetical protein